MQSGNTVLLGNSLNYTLVDNQLAMSSNAANYLFCTTAGN